MPGADLAQVLAVSAERREQIRAAVLRLERAGKRPTNRAVLAIVGGKAASASAVLKAWRAGLLDPAQPWGLELERQPDTGEAAAVGDLLEQIRSAAGPGDLARVCRVAAELAVAGLLTDSKAKVVRDLAQEQRRALADAIKTEPPPEDPTRLLLASAEALEAARAVDLICCDQRRDALLAHIAEQLELDLRFNPVVDQGGI
jgi:hypothetical protein